MARRIRIKLLYQSMKKLLLIFFFLFSICCFGQEIGYKCDIYQFFKNDTANTTIALMQTFNANGKVLSETYKGYEEDAVSGKSDGTYTYSYKDTFCITRTYSGISGDSTKTFYYYNNHGQLVRWELFTNGLSFEKDRQWVKESEVFYSYDEKGRRVLYDATKLHFNTQNKYTWSYDSLGRIKSHHSYNNNELIWIEDYTYFDGGYSYATIWYENGQPTHRQRGEDPTVYTFSFLVDDNGHIVKETITNEKGEQISVKNTTYNPEGKIIKVVAVNGDNEPEVTHLYVYH